MKSLEVRLAVEQAWQMQLVPTLQYKPYATNHLLVNMDAFARGQNLHWYTTMINTPWYAKIDAQQSFYFYFQFEEP